jgi:hypothetical protein
MLRSVLDSVRDAGDAGDASMRPTASAPYAISLALTPWLARAGDADRARLAAAARC